MVGTTADAVQGYKDWLTTTKYDNDPAFGPQEKARKKWILSQLPNLKGKELVYYKELGEPSHANALDELVQDYQRGLDIMREAEEATAVEPTPASQPKPSAKPVDTTKPFREWANPGQLKAYDAATAYLNNPAMTTFSITGSAGTGKTTLVKEIIKTVKGKRIVLSSPTHRANSVIRTQNPDGDIMTLHKLLGLKPFIDLTNFDASKLEFVEEGEIEMPYRGILLVDESSMIGDALYGLLIRTASQYGTKILFLGDMAQLGPVGQETDSRALTNSDAMADLIQVMRAKNAELLDESVHVREKGTFSGKNTMDENNNGVKFTNNKLAFIKRAIALFKSDEFKKNPLLVRVLPFLNDTVVLHNNEIREGLFGVDAPAFVKGELLMGYGAFSKGRNKPILVQNGIDYIVDKVGGSRQATLFDVPVTVYDATIRDVYSGETTSISLVDPNTPISAQRQINKNASPLKRQGFGDRSIWPRKIYPQLRQFAIPFDIVTDDGKALVTKHFHYGYSHTIHKSQGGTYKYVMVNDNDITAAQKPDEKTKSRLRYVGVTRAEHGAFILSRKGGIKPARAGVAQDQRFATLEEAQADPGVIDSMDKATKWLIRAFGPEIRQHMGWMLAREAPLHHPEAGSAQAGYYAASEYFDAKEGKVLKDFLRLAVDSTDPLSFAFHEGAHKFVHTLNTSGNQALYQRLVKAATTPHVMKQMERLLADYPAAIDDIRTVPEEAVAYAFQFYAASRIPGGPEFHLMNKKLFMRVIDTIKKMLGIMTNSNAAEHIFAALFEGRVNRDGIEPLKKYQERAFKEYAKDVMGAIRESVPKALSSPIIQLQRMRNADGEPIEAFRKLANYWHSEPLKGGKSGLIYRDAQTEGQFRNRWYKIVQDNNMTKEDLKSALLNFQSMKDPRTQFEKDLTHFLNRMWVYQFGGDPNTNPVKVLKEIDAETGQKAWVTPGRVKNYFSRIWSVENILANEIEFREVMAEEGNLDEETITNFIEMLQATNGVEAGAELQQYRAEFSPFNAAINARAFEFIKESNAHRFAKFQEQDMGRIMERYIRQAVHRREHSRVFEHDGGVIKTLFDEARAEGASPEQIAYAEKVVKGLEGRLGTDKVSDLQREIMVGTMSVTNIAVLALATFASQVDPLGVLVRTGSVVSAGKTFVAGFKQILADARKVKVTDQEITEYLGIIEEDMAQDLLNNMERGIYMNEKLRKVNKFFFKSIFLEQWTRGTRIGATRAAFEYLKKNADNAEALEELGLTPDQIELFGDRIKLKPEEFASDPNAITDADIEKARLVQNAVFRMVDESILRPSAASRPLWMSDMRFKLLGHLKSYTFTFHNQILRQLGTRAANAENMAQAALVFAPLLAYVPVMLAADMARGLVQGDDKDRDWDELLGRAFQRSAVAGMGTLFLDAKDEMDWGGLPTNTVLGPVIDNTLNIGRAATSPDSSFLGAAAKLLPYNALWRKWGEDD
jgi:exodeoxyribonuclease-5